jgi:L-lactate dehydrogenase complex protein LldE
VEIGLFVPCYVDQLAPSVGLATVDVLERVGCRVVYDPNQTCCGQPLLNLGASREAAGLARLHLERFSRFETIVCPSASCVIRERTFELGEFLVRELGRTKLGARFPHRVALLQSCHGLRELELGTPSERAAKDVRPGPTQELLHAVEGLELLIPERPDECCGFGGVFSVEFPVLSGRMGRDRWQQLQATGAEYVTSTDASCLLHLEGIRRRIGRGPRPIHLAEILAAGVGP